MFRGTPEISAGGLDDIVARMGAQMNGQTDYDYTQFYFVMPSDKIDVTLFTEADRMQHASLRPRLGGRTRQGCSTNSKAMKACRFSIYSRACAAAAFPGEPAGRSDRTSRDVANATQPIFAKYYHKWYAPTTRRW